MSDTHASDLHRIPIRKEREKKKGLPKKKKREKGKV